MVGMARLDFRLSDAEKAQLQAEAEARGMTLTEIAKERIFGPAAGDEGRLDDHERRLARLEEMAGL